MGRRFCHSVIAAVSAALLLCPGGAAEAGDPVAGSLKKQYEELNQKIEAESEKLSRTGKLERSVLGELDVTNRELGSVRLELEQYRTKLARTDARVKEVRAEIAGLKDKLVVRNDWMRRKLQSLHRFGRYGDVLVLLSSSEDVSELARRWKYLETLAAYERRAIEGYKSDLKSLGERESELEGLSARLEDAKVKVKKTEDTLSEKRKKKETLLASVRREKAAYQKMLQELKTASDKILRMLRETEADYADKGFRGLRGRLQWPLKGAVAIPYGSQKDPEFKTPVFRNGIYIEAEQGSAAKAVYEGKVVYADWFKGYGQLVIVNHGGGYHSLYANLSEIFLKTGDIIEKDAVIGKVGDSGMLGRPSLYFEIRYKGKPLNPAQWLK